MRLEPGRISESEGAACPRCGRGAGAGEHGIPIGAVVAAVAADRRLREAMEAGTAGGPCSACGGPSGWEVIAIRDGGVGEAGRRATLASIRGQLALGRRPDAIASWIRSELGVVGILVEDGSEVGRRLGCGWAEQRPGGPAAGRGRSASTGR
ncbi:MAG: hypothetical protein EDQ89_01680 [Acidobacteria bacterium]|nr:MAG: hypothetical protein EDQ89_01680 [Acidobacteriota bacterium]MCL4288099.1 hypothetical protein [Thermoleophilia bacterium]GIK77197.1 MAG: hypothetical protein BroJett022_08870 [Actinomycetes bacterium]